MAKEFYRDINYKSQKEIVVLLLLLNKNLVTYNLFSQYFDETQRTFQRIITTLRSSFEIYFPQIEIMYDKERKGYRLIQM